MLLGMPLGKEGGSEPGVEHYPFVKKIYKICLYAMRISNVRGPYLHNCCFVSATQSIQARVAA